MYTRSDEFRKINSVKMWSMLDTRHIGALSSEWMVQLSVEPAADGLRLNKRTNIDNQANQRGKQANHRGKHVSQRGKQVSTTRVSRLINEVDTLLLDK